MAVSAILPIPGVPDDLLRAINDRFRELSGAGVATTPSGSVAGLFFTHGNRPDANGTPVGTFGRESDRTVTYQVATVSSKQVWVYASGVLQVTFANRPTDLGTGDTGLLWSVSDYAHLLRWTGTGWEFVDEMGGYVAGRIVAPDGNGWQLCDGTATNYLHVTGGAVSEVAYTTLVLTGGAYPKFAAAYGVTITAATAPGVTLQNITAGGVSVVKTVDNTGQPAHLDLLPYFRR